MIELQGVIVSVVVSEAVVTVKVVEVMEEVSEGSNELEGEEP
jgi:hypothetical protein